MQKKLLVTCLLVSLGACTSAGPLLVTGGKSLPPPQSEIDYQNAQDADVILYSSLRSLSDLRANFEPNSTLPAGLQVWLQESRERGGSALICDTSTDLGSVEAILPKLILNVADAFLEKRKAEIMYSEVADRLVIAEFNSSEGKFSSLRFVNEDNAIGDPKSVYKSCEPAFSKG